MTSDTQKSEVLVGESMYNFIERLFPICRSITGEGVRQTLKIIQETIPLKIEEISTGTAAFDWNVPKEWNIKDAYVLDEKGNKIIDFQKSNLHVVGYSIPVNQTMSLHELQSKLHSLPKQPDAIPYVTSYYNLFACLRYLFNEVFKIGVHLRRASCNIHCMYRWRIL